MGLGSDLFVAAQPAFDLIEGEDSVVIAEDLNVEGGVVSSAQNEERGGENAQAAFPSESSPTLAVRSTQPSESSSRQVQSSISTAMLIS
ncbi:hypothetical protein ACSNOJ_28320 [Streptomyces sp. URMC 128]|uniref:hypothetical protein n=1 Tax=Streptomyces sp. URMC 128 TaxID=3423404 RepID=UPI003F1ABE00